MKKLLSALLSVQDIEVTEDDMRITLTDMGIPHDDFMVKNILSHLIQISKTLSADIEEKQGYTLELKEKIFMIPVEEKNMPEDVYDRFTEVMTYDVGEKIYTSRGKKYRYGKMSAFLDIFTKYVAYPKSKSFESEIKTSKIRFEVSDDKIVSVEVIPSKDRCTDACEDMQKFFTYLGGFNE